MNSDSNNEPINCGGKYKIDIFKSKNVDFEDAIEQTGFGKYNLYLILVCGVALYAINTEAYSVGFIVPSTECEWNLTTYTKGILTSSNFLGIMGSCAVWGYLSDVNGRKKLLIINFALSFLTSAAAALVSSFWGFVVLRFFNGLCISGPSAIVFAYFGEFQGKSQRSKAISYISLFIAAALIHLAAFGWWILPSKTSFSVLGININSWRLYMLINAIPNILVAVGLSRFPESPKYLYHSGKLTEALEVLRNIYVVNTGHSPSSFPVESLDDKVLLEKTTRRRTNMLKTLWQQVSPLFKPPHWIYTVAACFMQAGVFAISSGLYLWYPDIINQLANVESGKNGSMTVCQVMALSKDKSNGEEALNQSCSGKIDDNVFVQNIIIGAAYLVGYSTWGIVVNAIGNKNFFNFCMIISSAGTVALCFISQKMLIDVLFVLVLMLPGICVAVISASIVDIIPTHLCGMAVCITMTAGRLGSIVSSSIVGIMLEWNCTVTFMLYAANLVACFLLSLLFPKKS